MRGGIALLALLIFFPVSREAGGLKNARAFESPRTRGITFAFLKTV